MSIWTVSHREENARITFRYDIEPEEMGLNEWFYDGDAEFTYHAETEWQCRQALIERLDGLVRKYERIIAVEKTRLS